MILQSLYSVKTAGAARLLNTLFRNEFKLSFYLTAAGSADTLRLDPKKTLGLLRDQVTLQLMDKASAK